MNHGYVTLDEVLAAAAARAASLAPETSGYLALALGDAAARLPLAHDDRAVMLSTEGSVSLARRGAAVSPEQAARALRDVLARLLAVSAGTMPGLAAAARPRQESDRGVSAVVEEIESALIPVNRAAAHRALGRLAREALRAKDLGKVGPMEAPPAPAPAADHTPAAPSPSPALVCAAEPTPTAIGIPPVELSTLTPSALDPGLRTELDVVTAMEGSPTPSKTIPLPRRAAPLPAAPPRASAPTRADDLLARFGVSCGDEASMREAARCLRTLAGLEPTPPPPAPQPVAPPSSRLARELAARADEAELDLFTPTTTGAAPRARRSRGAFSLGAALLLGALVGGVAVARARPELFASVAARLATPAAPPGEARAR